MSATTGPDHALAVREYRQASTYDPARRPPTTASWRESPDVFALGRGEEVAVSPAPQTPPDPAAAWPELTLGRWQDTRDTLHLWTQIVGKVRLALEPMVNHWWQVALYVSARGLTTSLVHAGTRGMEIELDFRSTWRTATR